MARESYTYKLIKNPLEEFTYNVLAGWNFISFGTKSQPIVHYLLPSLLLQMCGFTEQKHSSMIWELGYHQLENRHNLITTYQKGSTIEFDRYKDFYNKILKNGVPNNVDKPNNSIVTEIEKHYEKFSETIIPIFEAHKIRSEIEYLLKLHKTKLPSEQVSNFIKKTVAHRNHIAHHNEFYSISHYHSLCGNQLKGFNYIDGYCLLMALDKVLTEAFEEYRTHHKLY